MTNGIYSTRGQDFHLQEYVALRAEILALLETLRSLERNVVFAVGVSWVWLADKLPKGASWAWLIPMLFPLLGVLRVRGILRHFGEFRKYITTIEEAYAEDGAPLGWQRFTSLPEIKETKCSDGTVAFWTVLIVCTVVVAAFGVLRR